mmetsp:Transcript_10687/g.33830  ORF Transcript_10687/g.33830 Transcript_10687/m.33830 type:complete len:669 (+) Transcript_10687:123-2129(+)
MLSASAHKKELEDAVESLQASVSGLSEDVKQDREAARSIEVRLTEIERLLAELRSQQPAQVQGPLQQLAGDPEPPQTEEPQPEVKGGQEAIANNTNDYLECSLGGTVWDAPVIIGLPEVCHGASAVLMVNLLLNLFVQLSMTWFLLNTKSFVNSDFFKELKKEADTWRLTEGHAHDKTDARSVNLVSRVCGQDETLSEATAQLGTLQEINDYLGLDPYQLEDPQIKGIALCIVCVILFILLVFQELRAAASSLLAVAALPRGCTRLEGGRFTAISRPRFVFVLSIGLVRGSVAVGLLCAGVMWLSSTSSVTDLILNAAALGFIIDFDECLWQTTVPAMVQQFANGLAPLRYRRPPFHLEALIPMLCTVVVVIISLTALILPFGRDMIAVKQAFCGDFMDFDVRMNPAGYIASRRTRPYSEAESMVGTRIAAVKELMDYVPGQHVQYSSWSTDGIAFFRDRDMTLDEQASSGNCTRDLDRTVWTSIRPFWFLAVRETSGVHRGLSLSEQPWRCADYVAFCDIQAGLVRYLCPISCGCADPRSGLLMNKPKKGCPKKCQEELTQALANASCVDGNVSNTVAWTRYWKTFERTTVARLGDPKQAAAIRLYVERKIALGCSDMTKDITGGDACDEESGPYAHEGLGAIHGFCPARCCRGPAPNAQCPRACLR